MIHDDLPLIDLHRHLDGSIRLETILELGRLHGVALPGATVEELRPHVQVTEPQPGLMAFIARFRWMVGVLADYDACRRVACENVHDARAEGLDYIELRFSPCFMAEAHGLDPAGVARAVAEGVEQGAQETGLPVGLIGILSRTYGTESAGRELEALLGCRDRLVALDLAGDEARFPGELFVEHFRRARDAGLRVTVHAGEAGGPCSVWQAVRDLGAERVGHAVRAAEDPALLDFLVERGVTIEANLTSNVQTSTVARYAAHPLRAFLDRGLRATINTDDPGISGIDLRHEFQVAAPYAGLTPLHTRQAQQYALEAAFLDPTTRARLAADGGRGPVRP